MEALAIEGMARVRLGYDTLLKCKVDEYLSLEAAIMQTMQQPRVR